MGGGVCGVALWGGRRRVVECVCVGFFLSFFLKGGGAVCQAIMGKGERVQVPRGMGFR